MDEGFIKKKKNVNTIFIYVPLLYMVLIGGKKKKQNFFFKFLFSQKLNLENYNDFMKFIFLGNKAPEELNEHLSTFTCSAQGDNLLQRQEKERVLYLRFRKQDLRSSSANH